MQFAASRGHLMTASISILQLEGLWNVLCFTVPPGFSRVSSCNDGIIASIHSGIDDGGQRAYHHLLSNGWKIRSNHAPVDYHDSDMEIVDELEENSHSVQEGNVADVIVSQVELIPQYTKEVLKGQKLSDLKIICKKWSIRTAQKKADVVANILIRVGVVQSEMSEIRNMEIKLSTKYFSGN